MAEEAKNVISIDGKDYNVDELPLELRNYIVARQEIQQSKVRHDIELEKIEVLTNYYNGKSVTITSALASDPTTGVVELTLTDQQTVNLDAPARYVYDVYITQTSTSTVTRVIEGVITVNPKV